MRYWNAFILILAAVLLSACNLSREGGSDEPLETATGDANGAKPTVTISSPESGEEVVVGDDVFVSATASDTIGVTEVQLVVNNQIVKRVFSESVSGDRAMNVLLDYVPSTAGEITLQVIARRGSVASDPVSLNLTVRSNQGQVTATLVPATNAPVIDPNDPTCRALVNTSLRLRNGPSTNTGIITVLPSGAVVPIIGRLGDNSWWQVRYNANVGWVAAEFTTVYGLCNSVQVVTSPVPPTQRPPNTAQPPTQAPPPTQVPPATLTPIPTDLIVTRISGPEAVTIPAGEGTTTVSYTVEISNIGGRPSGQFSNTLTLLPGGSPLDLGVVGNLQPNEIVLLRLDITFDTVGDFILRAQADSDNQVTELSEVNNTGTLNVVVGQAPDDLASP